MPIVYNILQIRYDCMTVTMPFDPLPLIGVNLWQRATRAFDPLSDAEDTDGLPLIQQEFLYEKRLNQAMLDCLKDEARLVKKWLLNHPSHDLWSAAGEFVSRIESNLDPYQILEFASDFYRHAERNGPSVDWSAAQAWTESSKEAAEALLNWRAIHPQDPSGVPLDLWFDHAGLIPQVRLLIWSLRAYPEPRAREIIETHLFYTNGAFPKIQS